MQKKTLGMLVALTVLVVTSGSALATGTGTVDLVSGWYPAGTNLTVTASPSAGDTLSGWSGNTNNATYGAGTISFTVDGARTIIATFADILHTITVTAGSGGSISPGTTDVAEGDDQGFTITPDTNYHISDVLVDGGSIGTPGSHTFTNVTAAHTLVASFAIDTYTVDFLAGSHGTLSGASNSQTIAHGSDATAPTINPNAGYAANGWNGSYTGITSDRTLTALYTTNEYTLTFVSAGSAVSPITQLYTTAITPPADPTRIGYSFNGWNPGVPGTMPLDGGTYTAQWTVNDYSFIVSSEHGASVPGVGTNWYAYGSTVDVSVVESPVTLGTTQYVAQGWVSTGSLVTGSGTNTSFTITNDTTMSWQWSTNYYIEFQTIGE